MFTNPPLSGIFLFSLRDTATTSPSLPALGRRLKKELCVLINLPRKEVGAALWAPGLGPQLSLESSSKPLAQSRAGQSRDAEGFQRGARGARLCLDGMDGDCKALWVALGLETFRRQEAARVVVGTLAHPQQSEFCFLLSTVLRFWRPAEPESHVCPLYPLGLFLTESKWFPSAWLKAWLTEGNFLPEIPGEITWWRVRKACLW